MSSARDVTGRLRERVWNGSVPLEIRLHKGDCRTYDDSEPYLTLPRFKIQFPRLSYLALLIHRLHAFFAPHLIYPDIQPSDLWLEHESVPLKWHYPLGLLYDIYSGADPFHATSTPAKPADDQISPLPWRLTLHASSYPATHLLPLDNENHHIHDLYIHSVKEADYLRTGTGKTVMFLSQADTTQLWDALRNHDLPAFDQINNKLLNPQAAALRHLPVRLYLPLAHTEQDDAGQAQVRVVQSLVKANLGPRQPQTIGSALNQILPTLFPSRRSPLLALPVLHGAVLPLGASVEDLIRSVAYLDGWLHIAIVMMA